MKDSDFVYASAYTRTLENKMLVKPDIEALLNASSLEDALRLLSDRGYGNRASGQAPDAETLLKDEFIHAWNEVKYACPEDTPIHILLYQNDFHNIKTILKAVFGGVNYEHLMLSPYTLSPDTIYQAITEGEIENLPDPFKEPTAEAYRVLARDSDGQLAEILLDKAMLSAIRDEVKRFKNDFLTGWIDLNIAIVNMKTALRGAAGGKSREFLRGSMLECQKISADELADAAENDIHAVLRGFDEDAAKAAKESVGAFERYCDSARIKYLLSANQKLFGFEIVFGFLARKQFELQAVRIILSGLKSKIPAETLRGRLCDIYV